MRIHRYRSASGAMLFCLLFAPAAAFDYGVAPNATLELDNDEAGATANHRLYFDVFAGELETYRALISYPRAFRFEGFETLGPPNSEVGRYGLDVDFDGLAERSVALRSLDRFNAYADVIADQRYSASFEPLLSAATGAEFVVLAPMGGDADPGTLTAPIDVQMSLTLFAGALRNPELPGTYTVVASLTSVDPDSDGADDGLGQPPQRLAAEIAVSIGGAGAYPFAAFAVDRADIERHGRKRDRLRVDGILVPDPAGDGIDLSRDVVTIRFGDFVQHIDGNRFRRSDEGFRFKSRTGGVRRLALADDGRFQIDARDLDLAAVETGRPVTVGLEIGDDYGAVAVVFDRNGHYRR